MSKVLVLNASYEPLNICTWRRAVVLLMKGKLSRSNTMANLSMLTSTTDGDSTAVLRKDPYKEISLSRRNLLHRDNYTCPYCGDRRHDLTIDHIVPRSKGGTDSWDNVVAACLKCNVKKGDRTPNQANMALQVVPRRPPSHVYFEISKHSISGEFSWKKYVMAPDAFSVDLNFCRQKNVFEYKRSRS